MIGPIIISAYDPGVTTGFAQLIVHDLPFTGRTPFEVDTDWKPRRKVEVYLEEFPSWSRVFHTLLSLPPSIPTCAVIENFQAGNIGVRMTSLEVIGVIQAVATQYGIPYHMQQPSDRKFIDTRWPRRFDQFRSHSGDALRHGLLYLYRVLKIQDFDIVPLDSPYRA